MTSREDQAQKLIALFVVHGRFDGLDAAIASPSRSRPISACLRAAILFQHDAGVDQLLVELAPMASRNSVEGMMPASLSFVAFTMTITRIVVSP
jgi:hypothetical protein